MGLLFVDTSGWYDLVATDSADHLATVNAVRRPDTRLVTSTYVLDELVALLVKRRNHETAARVGAHVRRAAEVRVEHPDMAEERRAWSLFLDRPDKTYTLTAYFGDGSTFVISGPPR